MEERVDAGDTFMDPSISCRFVSTCLFAYGTQLDKNIPNKSPFLLQPLPRNWPPLLLLGIQVVPSSKHEKYEEIRWSQSTSVYCR